MSAGAPAVDVRSAERAAWIRKFREDKAKSSAPAVRISGSAGRRDAYAEISCALSSVLGKVGGDAESTLRARVGKVFDSFDKKMNAEEKLLSEDKAFASASASAAGGHRFVSTDEKTAWARKLRDDILGLISVALPDLRQKVRAVFTAFLQQQSLSEASSASSASSAASESPSESTKMHQLKLDITKLLDAFAASQNKPAVVVAAPASSAASASASASGSASSELPSIDDINAERRLEHIMELDRVRVIITVYSSIQSDLRRMIRQHGTSTPMAAAVIKLNNEIAGRVRSREHTAELLSTALGLDDDVLPPIQAVQILRSVSKRSANQTAESICASSGGSTPPAKKVKIDSTRNAVHSVPKKLSVQTSDSDDCDAVPCDPDYNDNDDGNDEDEDDSGDDLCTIEDKLRPNEGEC